MAQAQLLIPTEAEAYLYDHPVVGRLTVSGSFNWNGHSVETRRYDRWTMVRIDGDTATDANKWAQWQTDRLASGLIPYYFIPAAD